MTTRRLAGMLGGMLCCLSLSLYAAPVDQAHERARATFAQKAPLELDAVNFGDAQARIPDLVALEQKLADAGLI